MVVRVGADGHETSFIYDQQSGTYLANDGSLASLTWDGATWHYRENDGSQLFSYDGYGQLIAIQDRDGHELRFIYDNQQLVRIY